MSACAGVGRNADRRGVGRPIGVEVGNLGRLLEERSADLEQARAKVGKKDIRLEGLVLMEAREWVEVG